MSNSLSSALKLTLAFLISLAFFGTLTPKAAQAQNGYYAASYNAAQAAAYQRQQQAAAYYQYQQQQAAYARQQQAAAAYQYQQQQQQAAAAYYAQQQQAAQAAAYARQQQAAQAAYRAPAAMAPLRFDGRYAAAPSNAPAQVHYAVQAANSIQTKPYRRGGGHANVEDNAYDCSGSVSYALIKAGLLRAPLPSSGFANYGEPGEGRFITIWVKPGDHVFMTICGLRMDTSGGSEGQGPRWRSAPRSTSGFTPRHPAGF